MPSPVPVLLMVRELGIGGCERDLAKMAKALDRRRFEPHVACINPEGLRAEELRSAGIPIVQLPLRSFLSRTWLSTAFQLGRYFRQHGIQLVQTFDAPMDMLALPIGRFWRVPVLIKSHLWFRDQIPRRYRALLAVTDRMADIVVVNSRAAQEHLTQHYGVPADRTYLCYNGVETNMFYPGENGRAKVMSGASLVIGSVCALRPEKRLDLLLDAFARVRTREAGVRLLIVGSGPMWEQLEQQRQHLGIGPDSHFEPSTTDVASWMRGIDIFVLSSETESFPNALLEAMACGCCVIGSRVGGVPELIRHEDNGLLFEPGNVEDLTSKLTWAMEHKDLRLALGAAAARTAREQFSMEIAVRRTEALYESLLNRRAGRIHDDMG